MVLSRCTEMSLQRLQTFKQRGLIASPVVTREMTRLAEETHHSQDQKVRLGVLQGWRLLNQGRFSETRLWMDEMVRQCKDYQLAHQMEMAKYIRKLAIDRIAI